MNCEDWQWLLIDVLNQFLFHASDFFSSVSAFKIRLMEVVIPKISIQIISYQLLTLLQSLERVR